MQKNLVIVRGGGDIATGTIQALVRAGFSVLVLETPHPSAIRRQVALSEAVYDGTAAVEDIKARLCSQIQDIYKVWQNGEVPVLVDSQGAAIAKLKPWAVVDAILAKRNMGTMRSMARHTIALGPGFTASQDVDAVIETMRGHDLGRIIWSGQALPNTGIPGIVGGYSAERVIHSPAEGYFYGINRIGCMTEKGQGIGVILDRPMQDGDVSSAVCRAVVPSSLSGLIRGMIRNAYAVTKGFKIADIDPRRDQLANCFTISDKARCLGGSVVTALLCLENH